MSRSKIKVLIWSPSGAGEHYHGPGTSISRLAGGFDKENVAMSLAHGSSDHGASDVFSDVYKVGDYGSGVVRQFRFLRKGCEWIKSNVNAYDIFQTAMAYEVSVRAAECALREGVPAVVRVARHKADLGSGSGFGAIVGVHSRRRRLLKNMSGVIALSTSIQRELEGYGIPQEKIFCIPNGVDTVRFRKASELERARTRESFGWDGRKVILFVGSVVPRKGVLALFEAFVKLVRERHNVQLVVVGPWKDLGYLAKISSRCSEEKVIDRVSLLGHRLDIERIYRASDVYVLPSEGEGMPNSLLEAMASGLPSVGTKVSGVEDIIEDGVSGLLCDDVGPSLEEALHRYVEDPVLAHAHGSSAQLRVKANFSHEVVREKYLRMYRRILSS